jgi:hypothetical protein
MIGVSRLFVLQSVVDGDGECMTRVLIMLGSAWLLQLM